MQHDEGFKKGYQAALDDVGDIANEYFRSSKSQSYKWFMAKIQELKEKADDRVM